jgi:DNA topoisomerase III
MKVVVTEKPSVARELASFLGATSRHEGYFEGKGYQVTWALGHLVTLMEPEDYDPTLKKWSLDTLPFVPERFGLKPINEPRSRKQLAVVRRLCRSAESLICATDAGREGELIFRYIQELVGCGKKPARRLWLSSLTESAIRDAFRRLRPLADFDTLYAAARCRSEADWVVGLNATRFYTVSHRSGGVLWSVGRVQTPVLAMIVRRDDEIRTFKAEPFWELLTRYRQATFKFAGERFPKEEFAQAMLQRVVGRPLTILNVERKPDRVPPPQLHDLTALQRDMNYRYDMSADATLKAAQWLYENKLISYPRTDSRYLGTDLKSQVPGILAELKPKKPVEIGKLNLQALTFTARIINDAKVGDHHAIIPTGKSTGELPPWAQKVFDAVVTRFIAVFYPACVSEVTTVNGTSNEVPFRAKGVRVLDLGWKVLYPRKGDARNDEDQELPEFRSGESGPHDPFVRRGETTPPKPYTEGSLLGAMETAGKLVEEEQLKEALKERGLGTPATRASIIETLLERGYITRDKKALAATDRGRYLVAIVQNPSLKSPKLTGDWEAKLRQVERGRMGPEEFMAEIVRFTHEMIRSDNQATVDPGRLGDCPRCGRPVIAGKRGYGCSGWRDGCPFVLWRSHRDHPLTENQISELLQRRVLGPIPLGDSAPIVLHLPDTGTLTEIPVPTNARQRPVRARSPARGGVRDGTGPVSSTGPRRRKGARRRNSSDTPRPVAPIDDQSREIAPRADAATAGFAPVALGPCPLCGSGVFEQAKSYGCSGGKQGCKFTVWKTIAGKAIGIRTAQLLLKSGHTSLLKGFRSKVGKPFEARLKLEGGEVRFDFRANDRPRRPPAGPKTV